MSTTGTRRLAAGLVGIGAALFAVGNLLHPLEHSEAAHAAATWEAAHLTFGLGGLLLAAGLPLLMAVADLVRPARLQTAAGILLAVSFAGFAPGAWFEAYVAPLPGGVGERLEAGPGGTVLAVIGFAWLLGALGYGIGLAWRGTTRAVRSAGAVMAASVAVLIALPGLPGPEGAWIIPATVAVGLALVVTAGAAVRRPAAAPQPQPVAA